MSKKNKNRNADNKNEEPKAVKMAKELEKERLESKPTDADA